MATLAEIRAKLREQEDRKGGGNTSCGDNALTPLEYVKDQKQF